jgi:hypothetical protein
MRGNAAAKAQPRKKKKSATAFCSCRRLPPPGDMALSLLRAAFTGLLASVLLLPCVAALPVTGLLSKPSRLRLFIHRSSLSLSPLILLHVQSTFLYFSFFFPWRVFLCFPGLAAVGAGAGIVAGLAAMVAMLVVLVICAKKKVPQELVPATTTAMHMNPAFKASSAAE